MINWWDNESVDAAPTNETQLSSSSNKSYVQWKFKVEVKTHPGEVVCVTGNTKELGNWINNKALILNNDGDSLWSKIANIETESILRYRYFIAIPIEDHQKLIVRRWETGINPRVIEANAQSNVESTELPDTFGQYNNTREVEKGWLTSETAVHLKLFNNPIKIWKTKLKNKKIRIKVTAVSLSRITGESDAVSIDEGFSLETSDLINNCSAWPITEIAVLNEQERDFKYQNQFGHIYNEEEYIVFQTLTDKFDSTAYLMDFYDADDIRSANDSEPPTHLGFCHILPSILTNGMGSCIVPITNSQQRRPIGEISVDYLVVTPLEIPSDMKITFASHWRNSWKGLDVGHRGAGVSFGCDIECANVRENTIASLKEAGQHGADLVEFDVQLSKDLIPIIYHDFYVAISTQRKIELSNDSQVLNDVIKIPVKDLTLEEMRSLKFYHVKEGDAKVAKNFTEDAKEEHQPFPKLEEAFNLIDESVGFNVELKWTMQRGDGTYELDHPAEINLFINTILSTVLKHAGVRNVVFSSFHPDIVTMLRLKQNKYPVILLTQGVTKKWPQYKDPRCHNVSMGINTAVNANLLGLSIHAEDILRDPSQVKAVIDSGLVTWCWGVDANIRKNVEHFKQLGVQAVINDKVVEFSSKNESVFMVETKEALRLKLEKYNRRLPS